VLCGQGAGPMSEEAMEYYYYSGHGIPAKGGGGGEGELAEFYYKVGARTACPEMPPQKIQTQKTPKPTPYVYDRSLGVF
jgi:hypothetical protein